MTIQARLLSRLAWLSLVLVLGAAGFVVWWRLSPGAESDPADPGAQVRLGGRSPGAGSGVVRPGDYLSRVLALSHRRDPGAINELIGVYGAWSGIPEALEARRVAVRAILGQPDLTIRIQAVLAAVDGDPTPRTGDPLWPELVNDLAILWTPETFDYGRDLMALETRAKPRQLILASFAKLAQSGAAGTLRGEQRSALASDFVDTYFATALDPGQKSEVEQALKALSGDDVVRILGARTIDPETTSGMEAKRKRALEEVEHSLSAQIPPTGVSPATKDPDSPPPSGSGAQFGP